MREAFIILSVGSILAVIYFTVSPTARECHRLGGSFKVEGCFKSIRIEMP